MNQFEHYGVRDWLLDSNSVHFLLVEGAPFAEQTQPGDADHADNELKDPETGEGYQGAVARALPQEPPPGKVREKIQSLVHGPLVSTLPVLFRVSGKALPS